MQLNMFLDFLLTELRNGSQCQGCIGLNHSFERGKYDSHVLIGKVEEIP